MDINMKLSISLEDKSDIECLILIIKIGLLSCIQEGIISIEDAEKFFYSPYSAEKLKKLGVDEEIVRLVYYGCELEDVESLAPERLNIVVDKIRDKSIRLLKDMPKPLFPEKKWID
jgi:hypothetical protein